YPSEERSRYEIWWVFGLVVLPAEDPPDLVARALLARIVGPRRVAARVHPDRPVERGHPAPDRLEALLVERVAVDVCVDLDAEGPELAAGVVDLREGGVGVVHRQHRDEAGEAGGMVAHEAGE